MSRNEYIKRFRVLIKRQRELARRENHISQKVDKYNALMMELHISLLEQSKKEKILQEQLDLLERGNVELEEFKGKAEERLEALKLAYKEHIEAAKQQESAKQNILNTKDQLHCLEDSFKVLIKLEELPAHLRGISLCDQDQHCKWTAFDIDPMQHTQAQVQDLIWQTTERGCRIYQEEWQMLFFPPDI